MRAIRLANTLLLLATLLLPGCSMLTAQGRQERAYAQYVRKASSGRLKQQKRVSQSLTKIPETTPSEPMTTTELSGPQSFGDGTSE